MIEKKAAGVVETVDGTRMGESGGGGHHDQHGDEEDEAKEAHLYESTDGGGRGM